MKKKWIAIVCVGVCAVACIGARVWQKSADRHVDVDVCEMKEFQLSYLDGSILSGMDVVTLIRSEPENSTIVLTFDEGNVVTVTGENVSRFSDSNDDCWIRPTSVWGCALSGNEIRITRTESKN